MDRSAFAELAIEQLKKARPNDAYVFDDEKFVIVATNVEGESSITSLTNYYDEWMHAPPHLRGAVLARITLAGRLVDGEEGLDEVRVLLLPRVRPRRYFEIDVAAMTASLGTDAAKKKQLEHLSFAEHLGWSVVIDRPQHIEYINDTSRFGVTVEELREMALANLKRATKSGFEKREDGVFIGSWDDEYAAERMLMPELFSKLDVRGEPVVFVPGAERIYVAGSDDADGIAHALALVDARLEAPRGLLPFGFVLRDGEWKLFEPEGELGRELGARLCHHIADAYSAQREELQKKFGDDERAPFVAGVLALAEEGGNLQVTFTTWGEGIHALLPRVQLIAMGEAPETACLVPWEDVMELAGQHLARAPDLYPPRWETKGFPDKATFEKLCARSVDGGVLRSASKRTRALVALAIVAAIALVVAVVLLRS
jgi:hypothetical protein